MKQITKLTDAQWGVIESYLIKYNAVSADTRDLINTHCLIFEFDGGIFITHNEEFDLFVLPEKRGRWKIRTVCNEFLDYMRRTYGKAVAKIYKDNLPSLRIAKHFQFAEKGRDGNLIRMEKIWAA